MNQSRLGIYSKLILPRLIELAMRNHLLAPYREQAITAAQSARLPISTTRITSSRLLLMDIRNDEMHWSGAFVLHPMRARTVLSKDLTGVKLLGGAVIMVIG